MTLAKLSECFLLISIFLVLHIRLSFCSCPSLDSCSADGPKIQFPFQINRSDPHQQSCGYPGFKIFCKGNHTLLELPSSLELAIDQIDYFEQVVYVYDAGQCLARHLLNLNLSSSPFQIFQIIDYYLYDYIICNCSTQVPETVHDFEKIQCLSDLPGHYYLAPSDLSTEYMALFFCQTIKTNLTLSKSYDGDYSLLLEWNHPDCRQCPDGCYLSKSNHTRCITSQHTYDGFLNPSTVNSPGPDNKGTIAGSIVAFLAVVLLVTLFIYKMYINRKRKEQDAVIEKFLKEHKSMTPTRYSYSQIKKMTNNFKNNLGEGGYGNVFKGKFQNGLQVAIKVLENPTVAGEEFINEVNTIGRIHHVNLVRLLGFCVQGPNRALIYEFMPNQSLEKYIFSEDDNSSMKLSWTKLNEIALGIARGIEYLHHGCTHRILHLDIKPQNILLDQLFTPKVSDFGLAKLCSKEKSAVSMTAARGTAGYIAPEIFLGNSRTVSHKSDVYSFGMLLLEMVGGQKNIKDEIADTNQVYFPEWIYHQIQKGEELRLRVNSGEDEEIAKRLTVIALWCIQWKPADRPSIKLAVQMLEGSVEILPVPPDPFRSYTGESVGVDETESNYSVEGESETNIEMMKLEAEGVSECSEFGLRLAGDKTL